jgi:hypothetical protein
MNRRIRQFFVSFKDEDAITVSVKEDVNRPNNPDCDQVLEEWIASNYGVGIGYEYWEVDTCEKYVI